MPESKTNMKDRILEATVQWNTEHPFQEPQLTQLAALVGISSRTLSRYFPSKEDLLGQASMKYIAQRTEEYRNLLKIISTSGCSGVNQIRTFLCGQKTAFQNDPLSIQVFAVANMRCAEYAIKNRQPFSMASGEVRQLIIAMLEAGKKDGSIRADLDNSLMIELMTAGFYGLMQQIATVCATESTHYEEKKTVSLYKEFCRMLEWYVDPTR